MSSRSAPIFCRYMRRRKWMAAGAAMARLSRRKKTVPTLVRLNKKRKEPAIKSTEMQTSTAMEAVSKRLRITNSLWWGVASLCFTLSYLAGSVTSDR